MQPITRKELQRISGLSERKERLHQQRFKVEGRKIISDLLSASYPFQVVYSVGDDAFVEKACKNSGVLFLQVSSREMEQMSSQQTPQGMLALAALPEKNTADPVHFPALVLESVQDPGNMGTIVRMADWFGIRHILCNAECADLYNPKVLQASMGSFSRISLHECDNLCAEVSSLRKKHPGLRVAVTSLDGQPIPASLPEPILICMGNESRGISAELAQLATDKLLIPGDSNRFAESLNVAVACGIVSSRLTIKPGSK